MPDFEAHARAIIARLGEEWTVTPEAGAAKTLVGRLAAPYGEVGGGTAPGVGISQPTFSTMFADLAAAGAVAGAVLSRAGSSSYRIAYVPAKPELPSGRATLQLEKV